MKRFFIYLTITLLIFQVCLCSVYAESNDFTEMYIYDYWTNSLVPANEEFESAWVRDLCAFAVYGLGECDCAPFAVAASQYDNIRQCIGKSMADAIDNGQVNMEDYGKIYFYKGEPYFYNGCGGYYFKLPKQYESEIGPITGKTPDEIRRLIENGLDDPLFDGGLDVDAIECFIRDTTGDDVDKALWESFQYCRDNLVTTYNNGKYVHDPVWTDNKFHAYLNSRNIWQYYPSSGTSFQNHPWRMTKMTHYTSSGKTYFSYDLYYFVQSYKGSDTQYYGQRGFVRQGSGRGYPSDGSGGWAGTVVANRYLPVGGISGRPDFIPYGNMGKKPTKWPDLKAYGHSQLPDGKIVKVSDLDGRVKQASTLANDAVDSNPDIFDSGDTTEDGMPIVPDDTPWPDPIEEYTTPEHNDGPVDPPEDPEEPGDQPGSGDTPSIPVYPDIPDHDLPNPDLSGPSPLFNIPDLTELWPFCIPFDILRCITWFLEPGEPVFDIPLTLYYRGNILLDYTLHIDLRLYGIAQVVDWLKVVQVIIYIIVLSLATVKILGGVA